MSDVINFPTKAEHEWKKVEQSIQKVLHETNASPEMQTEILRKMEQSYEKYNARFNVKMTLSLPAATTKAEKETISTNFTQSFRHLENQVQDFMEEILLDRLLLEIQLYNARKK